MKGVKTCGLVKEDKEKGLRIFAKPMGVVANIVPSTNPESTVCCIGLSLLKTRNAMIVSPHPRTQGSSYLTVEYGRKALRKVGAPEDLMLCIKSSSRAKARELMAKCDFVVATGGEALVKVVYAAGKPCHTVSAGNVVSIVDETADLKAAAAKIVRSKIANNSASCSSENAVALEAGIYDEMLECLKAEGGYLCSAEEREKLRAYMWPDGETLNRDMVAKPAVWIAGYAGIDVPSDTRFLMVLGEKAGPEDRFSGEKISPVLTFRTGRAQSGTGAQCQRRPGQLQYAPRHGQQWQLVQRESIHRHAGRRHLGRQYDQRERQLEALSQLYLAV
jgi:sulfoacetaldehyde dehydrogenase